MHTARAATAAHAYRLRGYRRAARMHARPRPRGLYAYAAAAGSRRWFGNAFGVLAGGIDRLVRRLLGCGLQRELGDIIELFRVAFGVCSI